jgi:hypothetical protein
MPRVLVAPVRTDLPIVWMWLFAIWGYARNRALCLTKRADEPQMDVQLLITLLIHVSCAIDHDPPPGDRLLDVALNTLAVRLNASYMVAGTPYGDDEAGFRRWLYERWPSPPTA